jgi:hypothetical protein
MSELYDRTLQDLLQQDTTLVEKLYAINSNKNLTIADVEELQKRAIVSYKQNPLMGEVLAGRISFEKIAQDLQSRIQDWERTLPLPKDERHNKTVKMLQPIIPVKEIYVTRGVFAPDNFAGVFAYMVGITYVVGNIIESTIFGGSHPEYMGMLMPLSTAIGAAMGGVTFLSRHPNEKLITDACYVDTTIRKVNL